MGGMHEESQKFILRLPEPSTGALVEAFTRDNVMKVNVLPLTPNEPAERTQSGQGTGKVHGDGGHPQVRLLSARPGRRLPGP